MKKTVIFDLDGTLALIDKRRAISTKDNGRMDWDKFFDPKNIALDQPNPPVVKMAQMLHSQGFRVVIFSGRSVRTQDATIQWLSDNDISYDMLQMRPTDNKSHYMPDNMLKFNWLITKVDQNDVFAVFDDRQQVVDMWRNNGLTCFQVAEGDF